MKFAAAFVVTALGMIFFTRAPHVVGYREERDRRMLASPSGFQTISMLDGGRTGLYYDHGERIGEMRPNARTVVMLGLGGGEMLRAARRTLPDAMMVGVEIDPRTAQLAREKFGMDELGVLVVVEDAAQYIARAVPGSIDALIVDLYDDATIPAPFHSTAFFAACHRALSPRGLLLMNVYPVSAHPEFVSAMVQAGFTSTRVETLIYGNALVFADR